MSKKDDLIEELFIGLKKKERSKSYLRFGLQHNPFPIAGLPTYDNLPPIDPRVKEKIIHFITSTYKDNTYGGLTIVGDYGSGKTHLLKYIKSTIDKSTNQAKERMEDFSAVTCFVDRPEDSPQRVVHKIIEDIGLDKIRKYVWKIIIESLSLEKETFKKQYGPKSSLVLTTSEQWARLFEDPVRANYLDFLGQFRKLNGDFVKLQGVIREIIVKSIVNDGALADRYIGIILSSEEKTSDLSWDVLAGHISKRDIQHKEIVFLNSIVDILRKVGFKHLYVFVDEFEDIGKLSSVKKMNYLLTLITLINKSSNWSVIVSLTNDVLEEEIKKEPPLYDRLTTTKIELKRLKYADGYALLARYLNLVREKATEKPITPFTEESVKRMIALSKGNCRSFLLLAYNALEIATRKETQEITPAIVDNAKDLRGI
jgi:Cdc6-like AAA superfamily ATPase